MPKNLSSTGDAFPTQTSPLAGEPRTAASVETPFQNAADRAAYLKRRLDIIQTEDEGVRRIRSVTSIAALQAVTDRPDGTIIEVAGVGLYRFDADSVLEERTPKIVKPSAITHPAPGRWLGHFFGMLDVANGIPSLNGDGRLPTSRLAASGGGAKILGTSIEKGLVNIAQVTVAGPYSTTSSSYSDVPDASMTLPSVVAGDQVALVVACTKDQGSPGTALTAARLTANDTPIALAEAITTVGSVSIATMFVAASTGSHTFRLQHRSHFAAPVSCSVAGISMFALHFRP